MAASSLVAVFIFKMILHATSNYGVASSLAQPADVIQILIYVWTSDENTSRKAGAKSDVYETVRRMLTQGQVPGTVVELLKVAI